MKKFLTAIALTCFSFSTFAGIDTYMNWGYYINCDVYNNSPVAIRVLQTNYNLQTPFGVVTKYYQCVGNCFIPPYSSLQMTGPANPPEVSWGTCNVNYRMY